MLVFHYIFIGVIILESVQQATDSLFLHGHLIQIEKINSTSWYARKMQSVCILHRFRSRDPSEIIALRVGMSFCFPKSNVFFHRKKEKPMRSDQIAGFLTPTPHSATSLPGVLDLASRRIKLFQCLCQDCTCESCQAIRWAAGGYHELSNLYLDIKRAVPPRIPPATLPLKIQPGAQAQGGQATPGSSTKPNTGNNKATPFIVQTEPPRNKQMILNEKPETLTFSH